MRSLWINIGDRFCVADFEPTLQSYYEYGFFGGIPLLRPPVPKRIKFVKIVYEVYDKEELAKRLREVADEVEKEGVSRIKVRR